MATRPSPALDPLAEKLRQIHTIPALVEYLHDELGWPVNVTDWEENLFDWQPDELNLKAEHEIKIKSIKQLRPLVSDQAWGVFFVEFYQGRLPVTALRRVLNGLVPKGRANGGGHQTWAAHDLLFISSFGESNAREIALAHFTDESSSGDLPTLRVLGWDDDDTPMQLDYVAKTLREKLCWPASTDTPEAREAWHQQWASAFALGYRQGINDAKTLALAMAELAKRIRRRVNAVLALENEKGYLRQMHKAFKDNLIADLSQDAFADMFAQTITYGLFTARASRESGALVADNLSDMVPSTNPFLKELLSSFLSAAGRARKLNKRVDFDELGINEVVTTLRNVPMDAVLRSFNASKPGDDPVIHFYEDFLKAYDKAMRAKRGVFYTPGPVVQFIVRSVDEILKTEFGIEDGLASTITWGEMMTRKPELKLPKFCTADTPFVQVLDPATGTGTFIVEVIAQIHAHMLAKWAKQGKVTRSQWLPLWQHYVQHHLLPRLYAFELMMAPYAIAHMKIGLKLGETGYTFPPNGPRVNVFLTNALEPAHAMNPGLAFDAPMLALEAADANRVKEQLAATVVLGNPPYSGVSNNMFAWIDGLLKGQLPNGTVVSSYYHVDGQPLGERKVWLQDDYVKFIRFGQWRIESSGVGVLGYITNHAYFDNPTFRGMRASLIKAFDSISVTDLHGSAKKGGMGGQDWPDENVFDIEQGVGVALMTRLLNRSDKTTLVNRSDLWGSRAAKYEALLSGSTLANALLPSSPYYFFKYWDETNSTDYMNGYSLPVIFRTNSSGIVTSKDHFVVSLEKTSLIKRIKEFAISHEVGDALLQRFDLSENYAWSATKARDVVSNLARLADFVRTIAYRPFDNRYIFYHPSLVWRTREEVMQHMDGACLSLISCRQQSQEDVVWTLAGVTKLPIESCVISNKTKEINYAFPLWLTSGKSKSPNLSSNYLAAIHSSLNLASTDYRPEDPAAPLNAEKIFHYIYAVLHSPAYRQRYAAFLRTDFPRIPIPGSRKLFDSLAQLGGQLVAWHLLEHGDATQISAAVPRTEADVLWFGADFALVKVAEKSRELAEIQVIDENFDKVIKVEKLEKIGKVFINATSGFANVHLSIWQHTIGGYQVLHKWLDDRRKAGRSLSPDDVTHWLRVYAALQSTQKLMRQVDEAIEANGGWPGSKEALAGETAVSAFSQNHPPPSAKLLAEEQKAQKEQLMVQKKAATAAKSRAARPVPMETVDLFDRDDDLDAMAASAGAPPRPKAKATPAKAVGGKAVAVRVSVKPSPGRAEPASGLEDGQVMCAIRRALGAAGVNGLTRDDLIRATARGLGYARTLAPIKQLLDSAIRRAVRRGIASNSGGVLTLWVKSIDGYDRDHLKAQLLLAIRGVGGVCSKADAPLLLARSLGFARTGSNISALVASVLRSLIRAKRLVSKDGLIQVL